jgi:hypothetical protein
MAAAGAPEENPAIDALNQAAQQFRAPAPAPATAPAPAPAEDDDDVF